MCMCVCEGKKWGCGERLHIHVRAKCIYVIEKQGGKQQTRRVIYNDKEIEREREQQSTINPCHTLREWGGEARGKKGGREGEKKKRGPHVSLLGLECVDW